MRRLSGACTRSLWSAIRTERKNYLGFFSRYPAGILHRSVSVLRIFVSMLKQLRSIADEDAHKFASEGFTRLFAMLRRELSDEYLARVERASSPTEIRDGVLISAGLGKGNKGKNYVLRKPHEDNRSWLERLLRKSRQPTRFGFILVMKAARRRCRN